MKRHSISGSDELFSAPAEHDMSGKIWLVWLSPPTNASIHTRLCHFRNLVIFHSWLYRKSQNGHSKYHFFSIFIVLYIKSKEGVWWKYNLALLCCFSQYFWNISMHFGMNLNRMTSVANAICQRYSIRMYIASDIHWILWCYIRNHKRATSMKTNSGSQTERFGTWTIFFPYFYSTKYLYYKFYQHLLMEIETKSNAMCSHVYWPHCSLIFYLSLFVSLYSQETWTFHMSLMQATSYI